MLEIEPVEKEMTPNELRRMLKELEQREQRIFKEGSRAAEAKVIVGYELKQIRDKQLYRSKGYKNMDEYALGVYGMERTVAARAMQFNDNYSVGGNSEVLEERFRGYNPSLLQEMLSLKQEGDFDLISAHTHHLDVRALAKAEKEQAEKEKRDAEQIKGQESLMSLMPEVVPESEKDEKTKLSITDVLRELFRPKEMKERLDSLVNMDPECSDLEWWVDYFRQVVKRMYIKPPFFLIFDSRAEGVKVKNTEEKTIRDYSYIDFYKMVRGAFEKEMKFGKDVWNQAFKAEYDAEEQKQREEEEIRQEIQKQREQRQKELQKQQEEKQRAVKENQGKSAVEESKTEVSEQKEGESAAALKKINENSTSDNEKEVVDNNNVENETEKAEIESETPEIVTGTVEQDAEEVSENAVCDIAQNEDEWSLYVVAKEIPQCEYDEIIEKKRHHVVLELELTIGSRLKIKPMERDEEIRVIITCMDVIKGTAYNAYGFEVLDYGKEE